MDLNCRGDEDEDEDGDGGGGGRRRGSLLFFNFYLV